ncbi:MAG TPA: hypothetical protein VGA88_01645 [Burkholderiales bacterium]
MSAAENNTTAVSFANRIRLFAILTVWSTALGPLIGGAPFNWTIVIIPYSYLIGGLPAFFGGVLYALVVASRRSRARFTRLSRLVLGAVCAAAGCYVASLISFGSGALGVLMMFGVPAGAICALLFREAWIEKYLFVGVADHVATPPAAQDLRSAA